MPSESEPTYAYYAYITNYTIYKQPLSSNLSHRSSQAASFNVNYNMRNAYMCVLLIEYMHSACRRQTQRTTRTRATVI
jgi:hypothetical protein